jgi:exosome complex component RRP4
VLGVNGYIWVSKHVHIPPEQLNQPAGMYSNDNDAISKDDRECIARVCNVITALANCHTAIHETIIVYAYDASLEYHAKELLKVDVQRMVIDKARILLDQVV